MSKIGHKDTKIELTVRSYLHQKGLRFRKNVKDLPGTPDIAIKKHKIVIFIHGCFWYGHKNCDLAYTPKSNRDFWEKKLSNNKERDKRAIEYYKSHSWHVFVIWECELKKDFNQKMESVLDQISFFLTNKS